MTPEAVLEAELLGVPLTALALGLLALTLLPAIWRVARGPSDADRAVGADHVFFVLVGSVALLSLLWDRPLLLDLVVVGTLVGFLSALVLGRYLGREGRTEPGDEDEADLPPRAAGTADGDPGPGSGTDANEVHGG